MSVTRERVTVTAGALEIGVKLTVLDCPSCGVIFAIPGDLETRRRGDGQGFYCPNGHTMSYDGKTERELTKLREDLQRAQNRAQWAEDSERLQRERAGSAERSLAATKGQVTRLRKRAVAGACPFGCRRHFVDVERHVATRHAGELLEGES